MTKMQSSVLLLRLVVLVVAVSLTLPCEVTITPDGNYSVSGSTIDEWLTSGPYAFNLNGQWRSTADGSLYIDSNMERDNGTDEIGPYHDNKWILNAEDVGMEAVIRVYETPDPIVMFIQRFPQGLMNSKSKENQTNTAFPVFQLKATAQPVGYLSFGSFMFGDRIKKAGIWGPQAIINDGLDGSGPLVLFDKDDNAMIVSPYNHFMAASMWQDKSKSILNYGVMGGVDELPEAFEYKTIAYCSKTGVGDAFAGWGQLMRKIYNKTDDIVEYHQSQDLSLTHLGYWTDNGAYYYYNTEPNKNYEETLLDVGHNAIENKIPYRYMQLDSWFYFKDTTKAVTHWDAMETIFPKGLPDFQDKLMLPIVAHNRYWSVNASYAKQHGGLFDFIIGSQVSLPTDQLFWEYLLGHGRENWGLIVYEQDWLNVQLLFSEALNSDLNLGRQWLIQMGQGASKHGLKIQYCMALSRHALQSLEVPVVTQARVSNDYHLDADQWKIGITSHFADAMGVAPSKDTFWTKSSQPNNTYNKQEPYPTMQIAISVLSKGPVGPGDMIGGTDIGALMKCCDADGLVLKPTKPARAINDQFKEMAFADGEGATGEVWTTYSTHDNQLYGIIFAANLSADYIITAEKAGFTSVYSPMFNDSVIYSLSNSMVDVFNNDTNFIIKAGDCKTNGEPYCMFYISPVLTFGDKKVALLGDKDKLVPMSERRVVKIWTFAEGIAVTLRGHAGEDIYFDYWVDDVRGTVMATADQQECATVSVVHALSKDFATKVGALDDNSTTTTTTTTPATTTPSNSTWKPTLPPGYECRFQPPAITTPKPSPTSPFSTKKPGGASDVKALPYLVMLLPLWVLTLF